MSELELSLPALQEAGRYVVAYSGGLDSTVLLHAAISQLGSDVQAIHVHHGLSDEADNWVEHCKATCAALGCYLHVAYAEVKGIPEHGLEAAARDARYAAFSEHLDTQDLLLLAQHADDQAETLFLQLLRGSGPAGLAAMPDLADKKHYQIARPLLSSKRETIRAYAIEHELSWIEDPSNADTAIRRNYLRHEVMPLIEKEWPSYRANLQRSAELNAEASALLDERAIEDLSSTCSGQGGELCLDALLELSPARQRNLLRYWIKQSGRPLPSQAQLESIQRDVIGAQGDAMPLMRWADVELRRYRNLLFLMPQLSERPDEAPICWQPPQALVLPEGCGTLTTHCATAAGLRQQSGPFTVRFNRQGESIKTEFFNHHKKLKKLFQEAGIPPWVRERMPLIYHGDNLVAVADRWVAADYVAQGGEEGWQIIWNDTPAGWPATE